MTAYEMRISDWSSDVCSSDLHSIASDRAFSVAPDCHGIQLSDSSGNADRFESGSLRSKVVGWRSVDSHLRILPWVEPAMDPSRLKNGVSDGCKFPTKGWNEVDS